MSLPNMVDAACICCICDSPFVVFDKSATMSSYCLKLPPLSIKSTSTVPMLLLKFSMTSIRLFVPPVLFSIDMPNSFIAFPTSPVPDAILASDVFNAFPACEPFTPEFAIIPNATAVSSTLYPSDPAIGAQYLKLSPIMETFVFAFDDAAAKTSANRALSFAVNPNAVSPSVTMSDVAAKSSPDAAARFIIPAIPSIISAVFQPAIAIYCIASALSLAENAVVAPICCAFAFKMFIAVSVMFSPSLKDSPISPAFCIMPDISSSATAPAIAPTFDIDASKSAAVFTAAVATPAIGRVTAFVNVAPAFAIVLPAFWICFPVFCISRPNFFMLSIACAEGLVKPSINCNAVLITLPTSTTSDRFLYFFVFFRFIPHFLPHICPRYALLSFRQAHVFKRFPIFKAIVKIIHVYLPIAFN